MCGRLSLKYSDDESAFREYGLTPDLQEELWPRARYNIAPSQQLLVVPNDGARLARLMTWGLVPSWSRDAKGYQINARSETAHEKPFFRTAFKKRRVVVLASGFYEWAPGASAKAPKTPWHFALGDGGVFTIAGLYDVWRSPDGEAREGVALLTTEANEVVGPVHHRMPVILSSREARAAWLAPGDADPAALQALLRPLPAEAMRAWPVSRAVNAPRNDGPELIELAGEETARKPAA